MTQRNEIAAAEKDSGDIVFDGSAQGVQEAIRNPKILSLPVRLTVSVGKANMTVREILALQPDAIIKLLSRIDDPVEIHVGDRLIGRGELVEAEPGGELGVKLIEICNDAAES